jgi:hypothetical protein
MPPEELEAEASKAYRAFCESARAFLPPYPLDWSLLPDVVKTAWKAAAAALLE